MLLNSALQIESMQKLFFKLLELEKAEIESEAGSALEWRENPDKTSSKILLFNDFDLSKQDKWGEQHKWFKENIEKFDKIFRKRVKKLNAEDWAG